MNFFTEHSTLLIIMLLIIVVGTFIILLKVGYSLGREMKRQDSIMEREYLKKLTKDFHDEKIESY